MSLAPVDLLHKLLYASKLTSANRLLGNDDEPPLHLIQPGGIGLGEVNHLPTTPVGLSFRLALQRLTNQFRDAFILDAPRTSRAQLIVQSLRPATDYALSADLKPETEYDPEKDILFLSGQIRIVLPFRTGEFYLFCLHDAHMLCCHLDGRQEVKKVVIKIRV